MEQQLNSHLLEIIDALDSAIQSAVDAPDSAGGASLGWVESLCRQLDKAQRARTFAASRNGNDGLNARETIDLLWQVRTRAGRLKMLIDSAAYFYAGLSSPQASGMDYNARGEWKGHAANRLIRIRC